MLSDQPARQASWRPICVALGVILLSWLLLSPPGVGPDEQSHLTRAAMVARGDLSGLMVRDADWQTVALPARFEMPDPNCYKAVPTVPVRCAAHTTDTPATAAEPVAADGRVELTTSATGYPIWAHLVSGIATWVPGIAPVWSARLATTAVVVGLLTAALVTARSRDRLAAAGLIVALTPMAWSTFVQVNPSAMAIAGGVALWTSIAIGAPNAAPGRAHRWLFAAGWLALVLPRRDGLMWACLSIALVIVADGRPRLAQLRGADRRPDAPALLVAASTLLMVVWSATHVRRTAQFGAVAPLVIVGAWLLRWAWDRLDGSRRARAALAAGVAALGTLTVISALVRRPGGWDGTATAHVIGETGTNLIETIGVLGWLDSPLPLVALVGWVALVGLLATAPLTTGWKTALLAAATLGVAIVASGVFELQHGSTDPEYWQGRYWLPLVVGVPIVLGARHGIGRGDAPIVSADAADSLARVAGVAALLVVNVAAWSAARRWGVGTDGSYLPWHWGTSLQPLPPWLALLAHGVATAGLAVALFGGPTSAAAAPRR